MRKVLSLSMPQLIFSANGRTLSIYAVFNFTFKVLVSVLLEWENILSRGGFYPGRSSDAGISSHRDSVPCVTV